ncbi:MAG: helix-turn-helix transcriptional regulator [Actinobacteria bacterium]|nr:helix-turn-helix transcriptional regulator [Actinomycetota bacterium]
MESGRALQGGLWIRQARLRAKLSQQELALRLETSQSLVARWERGQVEPGFATVTKAVRACGLDLAVNVVEYDHAHDLLIKENLRRSPADRLRRMQEGRASLDRLSPNQGR